MYTGLQIVVREVPVLFKLCGVKSIQDKKTTCTPRYVKGVSEKPKEALETRSYKVDGEDSVNGRRLKVDVT